MTAPRSVARLPPRRRRRLGLVVLVVLFALLLLLSNLVPLAAEWFWFQALGYERVFTTRLVAQAVARRGALWGLRSPPPPPVRRDGPVFRPDGGFLLVRAPGVRGRERSLHPRPAAPPPRAHVVVGGPPGHRRVPREDPRGAARPPAP